jgi:integrase
MPDQRAPLSDRLIARLPPAERGQYKVRDTELPGFQVVVGRHARTFVVKGERWVDGKRTGCQLTLGHYGQMTTRQARAEARLALGKIAKGDIAPKRGPAAPKPESVTTLRSAWLRYHASHMVRKGRSEATIAGYRDHVERLLKEWLDRPLAELAEHPRCVAQKHDDLTKRHGPYAANGALRTLRAIYNHARKTDRALPADNPTHGVDWNREIRRDTAMGDKDLPGWFEQLGRLRHPIRREFHLFMMLSGSRPGALLRAEIDHLDLSRRVLHIPRPKGGEAKAFDIPLSRAMVRCLMRAIRMSRMLHPQNADRWIFASDSAEGHIVEHKEPRGKLSKWGNDLRQTYRTMGQAAGVSRLDMHLLMNHTVPGVNEGYITRDQLLTDHLRSAQEKLSRFILQKGVQRAEPRTRFWPMISGRRIGDDAVDPTPLDPRVAQAFTRPPARANPPQRGEAPNDLVESPWAMLG